MKYEINDARGTKLVTVLKTDGTPAVEGVDYIPYTGEYHKNGKWSYSEGGVASRSHLLILWNKRSTHYNSNNERMVTAINHPEAGNAVEYFSHKRYPDEKPGCPRSFPFQEIWDKVVEAWVTWGMEVNPNSTKEMVQKWDKMAHFV